MALQGALQHMGEPEAQHWVRKACCRSLATCAHSLQGLLQSHGQKAAGQTAAFQVKFLLQGGQVWTVIFTYFENGRIEFSALV